MEKYSDKGDTDINELYTEYVSCGDADSSRKRLALYNLYNKIKAWCKAKFFHDDAEVVEDTLDDCFFKCLRWFDSEKGNSFFAYFASVFEKDEPVAAARKYDEDTSSLHFDKKLLPAVKKEKRYLEETGKLKKNASLDEAAEIIAACLVDENPERIRASLEALDPGMKTLELDKKVHTGEGVISLYEVIPDTDRDLDERISAKDKIRRALGKIDGIFHTMTTTKSGGEKNDPRLLKRLFTSHFLEDIMKDDPDILAEDERFSIIDYDFAERYQGVDFPSDFDIALEYGKNKNSANASASRLWKKFMESVKQFKG
jgi:hypothetical protein